MPTLNKRPSQASSTKEKRRKTKDDTQTSPDCYQRKSLFTKLVKQSGLTLKNGKSSNIINCDQTVFLKNFTKAIKGHDDYPEVVEDIIEGISEYVDDQQRFVRAMLTTELSSCDESDLTHRAVQDSIIRLMLKTQPLQSGVANLIIHKMGNYKEHSSIQLTCDSFSCQSEETVNVPQLILNQLRWLDVLDDSQSVASKLLEMAHVMPYESACAVITSLPEIVSDDSHDIVAEKLKELVKTNVKLTISVLDTLCSLSCTESTMEDFEQTIFSCLHSIKINELPIVVKYFLQTITDTNADKIASCLRQHLKFSPQSRNEEAEKTSIQLTAEALLSAIQYQPSCAEAFQKLLKNLKESEFTSSDFIILVLLCTNFNSGPKKAAVALMKSKLRSYSTIETLLNITFEECSHVLIPYFHTISDLAGNLLGSNLSDMQHMGASLYTNTFANLDSFCRQEVVGCLVQHIGSSNSSEVDCALNVLKNFAVNYLSLLVPFTLFVKGILDHIDRLSSHQIRLIYEVLSHLTFTQCEGRAFAIQDELHMLIRKQLTHSSLRYCYIGIIGSVKILSVLSTQQNCNDENYKTAVSVLQLLEESTSKNNKIRAYYLDELATLFQHEIDFRIQKHLHKVFSEEISLKFSSSFDSKEDSIAQPIFGVGKMNKKTHIPIYSAVQASDNRQDLLCPLFRANMETFSGKTSRLSDLALSPILLHEACSLKDFKVLGQNEQKMIVDSLFITMNWFREHINAFTSKEWKEHGYALTRIKHYIAIEKMLHIFVPLLPRYSPPIAIFDFCSSTFSFAADIAGASVTQDETDPNFTRASSAGQTSQTGEESSYTEKASKLGAKSAKKKSDVAFDTRSLKRHYLRELDPHVFSLLKTPMGEELFETNVDITSDSEQVQLFPDQLLFILQDLKVKIQHKLVPLSGEKKLSPFSSDAKHVGFEKLEKIEQEKFGVQMCELIPYLCNHLEAVSTPFQDDSMVDVEDMEVEKQQLLIKCYEHIIEILSIILSWKGLQSKDGKKLPSVLSAIARRIAPDVHEGTAVNEQLQSSFSYVSNFETTVTKVSLTSATYLAKLLSVIASFDDDFLITVSSKIREFTEVMLKTKWPTEWSHSAGAGAKRNDMLGTLLRLNLRYAEEVLQKVSHFVDNGLCKIGDANEVEYEYPTFQKANAHILYVCLMENLASESNKIPAVKVNDDESSSIALLLRWNDCMKIAGVLIRLLRQFHTVPNIVATLKYGRTLIDHFIKNGMPVCEKMFHTYQDDVVRLLKDLQISTRLLQHLTCHSKVTKNVSLSKHVPPLKRCLETLLFRVKAMLALHSCQGAFWLGNLKNRNIQGEEILSQAAQVDGESDDDSESINHDVDMSYSESY